MPADHYFMRSQEPLQALFFLLPLLIVYEVGAYHYAMSGRELRARSWVMEFFEIFGAAGDYLPGLAVVVVLLAWHFVRGDRARLEPRLYLGMSLESLAMVMPLLMFGLLSGAREAVATAGPTAASAAGTWQAEMVLSIGAGVYEELVFRLVLIAVVHAVLVDMLAMPAGRGAMIAIAISAVLFAVSHFRADNPFTWSAFTFYTVAGLYFAMIYVLRGFGIVVATHALYDVFVIAIRHELIPLGLG